MPMTVPGMAKLIISTNSNRVLPGNLWRAISQAVSSPTAAVNGAEISAIVMVVQKLFHATPTHRMPSSKLTPKARI
ncbi:hypothetical protein D9M69_650150 [compost metagenome]